MMASQNELEYPPKEGTPVPPLKQPKPAHSEASEVLETVKNLIVELQSFKVGNEQINRAQEKQ